MNFRFPSVDRYLDDGLNVFGECEECECGQSGGVVMLADCSCQCHLLDDQIIE